MSSWVSRSGRVYIASWTTRAGTVRARRLRSRTVSRESVSIAVFETDPRRLYAIEPEFQLDSARVGRLRRACYSPPTLSRARPSRTPLVSYSRRTPAVLSAPPRRPAPYFLAATNVSRLIGNIYLRHDRFPPNVTPAGLFPSGPRRLRARSAGGIVTGISLMGIKSVFACVIYAEGFFIGRFSYWCTP